METVLIVKSEDKDKVKEILDSEEKDYFRGSYDFKEPKSLEFDDEGVFLVYKGDDELVKKLKAELKDLAKEAEKTQEILDKIKADEESANVGMGAIFG